MSNLSTELDEILQQHIKGYKGGGDNIYFTLDGAKKDILAALAKDLEGVVLGEKYDMTLPVTDEYFSKSDGLALANDTLDQATQALQAYRERLLK